MKRPNIIFYFSDQQRWDTLGCYGQRLPVTPNLDRIAAEGTRFERAFTCQPVCGPARACLQTGLYATQNGCTTNGMPLPLDAVTIAKLLDGAGYDTAYVGKWHLASDRDQHRYETSAIPPQRRGGYRHWMASDVLEFTSHGYNGYVHDADGKRVDFTGYRADCINNFAVDYIQNADADRPFFLFVSQIEPHHQNDRNRYEGPDGSKRRFAHYDVPGDLVGTQGDWRENYPDYLGCCNSLDYNVGRLFDTLEERGLLQDTVFIYTSDHGSHFCTRNSEYKRSCHDGCIRIPMIAHGPGFMGGKVENGMVSLIDIPSTILSCAGVPVPEHFMGRELNRMVEDPTAVWKDDVFLQISESQIGRCIRTDRWKYSVRAQGEGWSAPGADIYYENYLYDLQADPHERNNLVTDQSLSKVRAELAQRLIRRMQLAGEDAPLIEPFSERPQG